MELEHGIFSVKLRELEQAYGQMQHRIRLSQGKNLKQIHEELEQLWGEYHAQDLLLDETVRSCRSPAMASLAEIQRDYGQQAEKLLQNGLVSEEEERGCIGKGDRAEATTLYAEFAIDFATQAMRYALIAALSAMELQIQADENTTKGESDKHE
jgi:hypothetical protein